MSGHNTTVRAHFALHHIEAFVALCDCGGVGRAADRLHMAQPAMSRKLAQLESLLGARLFERRPLTTITLTTAGEQFLSDCRAILTLVDRAAGTARLLQSIETVRKRLNGAS